MQDSGWCAAVIGLFLFGGLPVWAQISPGELSRSHTFLQGPLHCLECHKAAVGEKHFKCTDCHLEIRQRLEQQRGLHSRLLGSDRDDRTCVSCHSEHNGEDFALIHWDSDIAKFDHRKTTYWLEGRHAGLDCRKCHNAQHISAQEEEFIRVKDLNRTFLGLSSECLGCHRDEHRGQLEGDCRRCHGYKGWKEGLKFEHNMARYKLNGRHEKVACQKCHPRADESQPYTRYRGLSYESCTPCHADHHRGAFVNPCISCHNTSGWTQIKLPATFDHSKTRYELQGKHASVVCAKCHQGGKFAVALSYKQCSDCHRSDPHKGQFASRPDRGECSACHTVEGFKPARYDLRQHAATRFPLEGKHASATCSKCHVPAAGRETPFKFRSLECGACHSDIHRGQFSGAPLMNACESCHSVQGFRPARFSLARHAQTRYPLNGAHLALQCTECHHSPADRLPREPARFRFSDLSCTGCHSDPHNNQFAARMSALRADGSPADCEACHVMKSWKTLSAFDHSATAFPLVGAHAGMPCERCHRSGNFETGITNVAFQAAPRDCAGCHDDIHGRQFAAGNRVTDCARCHTAKRWRPSLFDHERDSSYAPSGAHREVPCNLCHTRVEEAMGRSVRVYRLTPRTCLACHGPEVSSTKPPVGG